MNLKARADAALKEMYPGSFAIVMATGVISVGAKRLGHAEIAGALLWTNMVLFAALWLALLCRIVLHLGSVRSDIGDHWRGAGFFTVPAACAVFGIQWLEFGLSGQVGVWLWWLAFACWLVVTLVFFCSMVVGENQVDIHSAINGAWLTAVVATQGLSLLTSALASRHFIDAELGFYGSAAAAGAGAMLYVMLISSIFYRLVVHPVRAVDFSAPYWVNMGAAMITALAMSRVSLIADPGLQPTLKLLGLIFWAFGAWWLPILVALGIWRHGSRKVPLSYDPRLWSLVFPLGMFAAATHSLYVVWHWGTFFEIAAGAFWVAASAWGLVMLGLVKTGRRWVLLKA